MPPQLCPRCGTPRRADLQVCVRCEMPFDGSEDEVDLAIPRPAAPSTVQSHGTVLLGILAGFVVLAFLLWLSVRDVGPFRGRIVTTGGTATEREVVVEVTNEGERAGRGNCQIVLAQGEVPVRPHAFTSQRLHGGETVEQTVTFAADSGVTVRGLRCT